jgi:hypothetical protein
MHSDKQMILIGNSFPLSLIRRKVVVTPASLDQLREAIAASQGVCSFWGHRNTLVSAEAMIGHKLAPLVDRPVLALSPNQKPYFEQHEFSDCWVVSPNYVENFRPAISEEVPVEKIRDWQVLHMYWE